AIVSRLSQTIPSPAQVVITAELDGNDVTQFADVFLKRTDLPNSLRHLKLNISDSGQPFARSIFFVISNREGCRFNVQSDDRTWTNGAYASLLELSNRYVSKGLVLFQRYGLNLNGLIFLAALVMLPSLPIVPRIIFLFGVIALLFAFKRLHDSFIRTRVYLDDRTRFTLMREYPAILSAVIASAIIGLVSLLFKALSSNEPFSWLFYLFPR